MNFDLIIVGAGPAGITAAVYAARKKLKTLVITKNIGGQAALSSDIENYTGYQFISGSELAKKFADHIHKFDDTIEIIEGKSVDSVSYSDKMFIVKSEGQSYDAKSVILAAGRRPRELGIPGEREYKNKGVTYCATCDGPLFSGKDVAIIGGGNSALDAALQMLPIANRVYIINVNKSLSGDNIFIEKISSSDKVEIINNAVSKEIFGETFVKGIKIEIPSKDKIQERIIDVEGVFIEIGSLPVEIDCNAAVNKYKEIIVNERCETNIPGLFAAGDITNIPEKQIIAAAGHGCIASLSAFKHIQGLQDS